MKAETMTWIPQLWVGSGGEAARGTVVLVVLILAVTAVLILLLLLLFLRAELGRFLDRTAIVRWFGFEAVAYRQECGAGDPETPGCSEPGPEGPGGGSTDGRGSAG